MKIQPYIEKLNNSEEFKKFTEQNSDAFLVAGFFILDFETKQNMHQIDYYIPSKKKVAAFTLDEQVTLQMMELLGDKVPEKLDIQTNIDLDALQGILQDEMKNRNISEDIKKIIAVIQKVEGKKIWNLNCVLTGMELLNSHVDDETKNVLKMEKLSMMDLIRKMPAGAAQKLQQQQQAAGGQTPEGDENISDAEKEEKLKKLQELEKAIDAEKKKYEEDAQKSVLGSKDN